MSKDIQDLVDFMKSFVHRRWWWLGGLSANQVGSPYKIAVINLGGRLQEIINPEYVHLSQRTSWGLESCISFFSPFFAFPVRRSQAVTVQALNRDGDTIEVSFNSSEGSALLQHEIDHLNGITIINWRKRENFLRENQGSRLGSQLAA